MTISFLKTALLSTIFFVSALQAQDNRSLPADIDPVSLARVGVAERNDFNEYGKKVFDRLIGVDRESPMIGPGGVSMHLPRVAEAMDILNQYLRYDSVIGRRYIEVAILVAAREIDQQFEYTFHEPVALKEGTTQAVVEAIKYNQSVDGLPAKESLIIRYGRELLRDHHLDSATWTEAITLFGQQGAMEIAAIMGDYVLAGIMLTAVDQQLPASISPLLPIND